MNPDEFRSSPAGRLVPTLKGTFAYVPNPLPPPALNLSRMVPLLATATRLIGELSGIGRTLPNPHLLIRPYMRTEAMASSKIEGTETTISELLIFEVSENEAHTRNDTREVHNYVRALQFGLSQLPIIPVSKRLIRKLHEVLMADVAPDRGAKIRPGEFKTEQNWIRQGPIENARFVPPPPLEALDALSALENYIHDQNDDTPLIIKIALIHYQFETIHPFPDGNGRVGRLLIPLLLCDRKEMSHPLLYLSPYFEKHYDEYIDRMLEVSRSGAWEDWIEFFLKAVEQSCLSAIKSAHAVQDLHRQYRNKLSTARSSALLMRIVDSLFDIPAMTVPYAVRELGISYNAAKKHFERLVEEGILSPDDTERRPKWFFARQILSTVYDGPSAGDSANRQN